MYIDINSSRSFDWWPRNGFHGTHDDPLVLEKRGSAPLIFSFAKHLFQQQQNDGTMGLLGMKKDELKDKLQAYYEKIND